MKREERKRIGSADREFLTEWISTSPDAIITIHAETHEILAWNESAKKMTGYSFDEMKGKQVSDIFVHAEDVERLVQTVSAHRIIQTDYGNILTHDGEELPVYISASWLEADWTRVPGVVFVMRNIFEIEEVKDRMLETQKLAAMAKVAGAVTHEIKNPLNSIFLHADLLEDDIKKGRMDRVPRYLDIIREEISRLDDIIHNYLSLSRLAALHIEKVDLKTLICEFIDDILPEAERRSMTVRSCCDEHLPLIALDRGRFERALLNLFKNACDAIGSCGMITISATLHDDTIEVTFSDTGCGIPEEYRTKIFTPFFTTKESGTGLGVYLVKETVEAHGGSVTVESCEEEGTIFHIFLPLSAGRQGAEESDTEHDEE